MRILTALLVSFLTLPSLGLSNHPPTGVITVAALMQETAKVKPDGTKVDANHPPDIPDSYQVKLQAQVIKQQQINKQMSDLKDQFAALSKQLQDVNAEGMKIEKELMKSLNLEESQFTVKLNDKGVLAIVKQDNPKNPDARQEKK